MRWLAAPWIYRLWRPRHIRYIGRDLWHPATQPVHDHKIHLEATLRWLARAQDIRDNHHDAGG
ncbi:MAG: hypothetical protein H7839_24785, partial [Magnetococcus sp. YQC-5]